MNEFKKYRVTLRKQFPSWDEKNGIPYMIEAKSKSDAIKKARYEASSHGHTSQEGGRYWFKAEETNEGSIQ